MLTTPTRPSASQQLDEARNDLDRAIHLLEEAQRIGHVGSWAWWPDTGEVEGSVELFAMLGLPCEARTSTLDELIELVDDRDRLRAAIEATAQRGVPLDAQLGLRRPDGLKHQDLGPYPRGRRRGTVRVKGAPMTDLAPRSPVRVRGHVDPQLHRWLWLVKWFLVIPHLLVLIVLWIAFIVLTIAAGVAIAVTGHYPRAIFDFNVGVMRWTWRVRFYAFTLGTDRYPPFSLEPDDSYPAQLEVDYPEHLSRGLVWVKWWLLAIPHYLVVAFFSGGAQFASGLTAVLALIAGVTLAATGTYPDSIFTFVMGMHRWTWRVAAYASLMRDEYPPFRLDNGPDEPDELTTASGPTAPTGAASPPASPPIPPASPGRPLPA